MKVLGAYLLAKLGGNNEPSAQDLKDILGSVGIEADDDRLELLLSQVKGKELTELIAAGREKMASVSGRAGAPVAAVASTGGDGAPAVTEAKTEEKDEEKVEESDDENMLGLFDD